MKLAEALIERADVQKRMKDVKQRLATNARVQEGDQPQEDPNALSAEYERLAERLLYLIQAINATNVQTALSEEDPKGPNVAEAIAERDVLRKRLQMVRETIVAAAIIGQRNYYGQSRNEIRIEAAIDVPDWRQRADALAREQRELDTQLQARNWTVELLES
jgi:hypothetical protein